MDFPSQCSQGAVPGMPGQVVLVWPHGHTEYPEGTVGGGCSLCEFASGGLRAPGALPGGLAPDGPSSSRFTASPDALGGSGGIVYCLRVQFSAGCLAIGVLPLHRARGPPVGPGFTGRGTGQRCLGSDGVLCGHSRLTAPLPGGYSEEEKTSHVWAPQPPRTSSRKLDPSVVLDPDLPPCGVLRLAAWVLL